MSRPKKGNEHPRAELAEQIGLLVAIGTTQDDIARMMRMSKETLHRCYKDELELGTAHASAVVGGKIFEAASRGEAWACSLWAARRMGWKEKSEVEVKVTHEERLAEVRSILEKKRSGEEDQT